jgi:hypothetical protein
MKLTPFIPIRLAHPSCHACAWSQAGPNAVIGTIAFPSSAADQLSIIILSNPFRPFTMATYPSQQLFDAVDDLSAKLLVENWIGSIVFKCVPVIKVMVGEPLSLDSLEVVDICHYLGVTASPIISCVDRLYLDPSKYHSPPSNGDPVTDNPHYLLLKNDLQRAASEAGSPIMSNGGGTGSRLFRCSLRNRVYK